MFWAGTGTKFRLALLGAYATGAVPTSNGAGLVGENNFLQIAFSVVFIDTHLENIISVFVFGVAVKRSIQLMCNLMCLVRVWFRIGGVDVCFL